MIKGNPDSKEARSTGERILVIQTAFIGDVILATSLLETLHKENPFLSIDILVRKGNEALFKTHPYVQNVLIWNKKEGKYKSLWKLLQQIRSSQYDKVINLQRYGTTGLLTALSGAKETIGFQKNPLSFAFTKRKPHEFVAGVHEADRNYRLIEELVHNGVQRPCLYPSANDFEKIKPLQATPYICIAPTSVWFTKQYPEAKWIELINSLDHNFTIYLVGAPSDRAVCARILEQVNQPNVKNICGDLSLLQSAALFKSAIMNYVNDSAPMHLCSAMNAPVTAIYCSTVPEFGYGPLSEQSRIVETKKELSCRPCGIHGHRACPEKHFNCGFQIEVSQLALSK